MFKAYAGQGNYKVTATKRIPKPGAKVPTPGTGIDDFQLGATARCKRPSESVTGEVFQSRNVRPQHSDSKRHKRGQELRNSDEVACSGCRAESKRSEST